MPGRILPLSEDAISRINSSKQITSLSGVILALLENALDADATKIEVFVNFGRGSCLVEDNGTGIPSEEFSEHGGLGKTHHTSKAASDQTLHGNTGTYLASLAALSMISITSRYSTEDVSATMIMHQGRVIVRHLPSLHANELAVSSTHGTRVSVNDLFGNMPVRVKQRALLIAQGTSTDDRTWLDLKRDVVAILLAWKSPCSVKLRDSEHKNRNLTLSGSHSTISSALTERNLNTLHGKTARYDLRDAFPLLFQAGLAPYDSRARWVPVSASTSKLSCHGLICLDPSPTRLCQFVSIGIHPCTSTTGHSIVYDTINKLFSNSSFGTTAGPDVHRQYRRDLQSSDEDVYRQNRTSKGIDRWPMFVIQLNLKDENEKRAHNQCENQIEQIVDVLEAMIRRWLDHNDHRPQQKRTRKDRHHALPRIPYSSPSHPSREDPHARHHNSPRRHPTFASTGLLTAKTSGEVLRKDPNTFKRPRTAHDIDYFSKIKSGKPDIATPSHLSPKPANVQSKHFTLAPLEPGSLSSIFKVTKPVAGLPSSDLVGVISHPAPLHAVTCSDDFGSISETDLLEAAAAGGMVQDHAGESTDTRPNRISCHDDEVEWKDPITKQMFMVSSRTGIVIPRDDRPGSGMSGAPEVRSRRSDTTNVAKTSAGKPLTLNGRGTSAAETRPRHDVPSFLTNWQNPVFARQTEQEIPITSVMGLRTEFIGSGEQRCNHDTASNYFAASGSGIRSKLSKTDLQHTRVVHQVDAKFILCSLPSADKGEQTLVLVDQHAASERVILESLLSDLCSPIDQLSPAASLRTNLHCTSAVGTIPLDQSLFFEITAEESDLFRAHATLFARFGVLYDLRADTVGKERHTLVARALPPAIAERCKLFPKLLIDLLRSEIWSRVDSGKTLPAAGSTVIRDEQGWIDRVGSCPKALLDMLNSRACRSAVMFNDVLSMQECEDLMAKLAKCAFPFMCAHGRVSMVPVGVLSGGGEALFENQHARPALSRTADDERPFSEDFRAWRAEA